VLRRHKILTVLGLVTICAVAGALVGSTLASGNSTTKPPVAALASPPTSPPADPASVQNLADAVSRWNSESTDPGNALGAPLVADARDLISGVGSAHDTVAAFPSANGGVCYEVLAAGSCGRFDQWPWSSVGFTFSILDTRGGGTRVYGVVSDSVQKIDVEIAGVAHPAIVSNNAFYYQLPPGFSSDDVQSIIAAWKDGSVHTFHWKDGSAHRVDAHG
jgi:hypothetical protein